MNTHNTYLDLAEELLPPLSQSIYPATIERGEGSYLYDIEDKRYIDFATGIAVAPVGHCHPKVVKSIQDQSTKLVSSMAILNPRVKIDLAQAIVDILPEQLNKVFFCNSGTESVEGSLKLARKAKPNRPNFIAFNKGFHGRSLGALSVTSKGKYRKDFTPLLSGCYFIDYPHKHITTDTVKQQLETLFANACPAESVAAIIVEPIIGEGGYIIPPSDFLPMLRQICDQYGILLILDEIQTGFGRTGKWFAFEHTSVVPDILLFAKGVASGLPLGGFAANNNLMDLFVSGSHGSTFGGNPISCAASLATIETIQSQNLLNRVQVLGRKIVEHLKDKFGHYLDIRGQGFMIAIEPKDGVQINLKAILDRLFSKGLIMLSCADGAAIRLIPALNISESVLHSGLGILEQVLDYELLVFSEYQRNKQEATP